MPAPKRILVIEDEEDIRTVIQKTLSRAGYEVEDMPYLATSVGRALSEDYDLITLDLNMPGIDGGDVAELFQHEKLDTPVLVISAYLDQPTIEKLREKGIRHFLSKPFKISELLEAVEKALSGKE